MTAANGRDLYDRVAVEASGVVIRRYSSSFGLASRLLERGVRRHVTSIYALVRLADEVVDGVAASAGLPAAEIAARLDALEREVEDAVATGYSTNLVVHAFAGTARATGFGAELTRPFFASMRTDLTATEHTPESFRQYVYGSAEVVGLMCLAAFLEEPGSADRARLGAGARALGAAFQKVNFLRDLATDFGELGRSYFPGVRVDTFDEAQKTALVDDLDLDLARAASILPDLPDNSRRAVRAAHGLFAELSRRVRATPAARLATTRVRVPGRVKLRIAAAAAADRSLS